MRTLRVTKLGLSAPTGAILLTLLVLSFLLTTSPVLAGQGHQPYSRPGFHRYSCDSIQVADVKVTYVNGVATLSWPDATPRRSKLNLSGYHIYSGTSPDASSLLVEVPTSSYSLFTPPPIGFFKVFAYYDRVGSGAREGRNVGRDERVLLDFEDGDLSMLSYSAAEDSDSTAWAVTDSDAFAGTRRSLTLFGNTWKMLPFRRTDLTDTTVWTIGVKTLGGDTTATMQAFGIGDGGHQLLYAINGRRLVWDEEWQINNQDTRPDSVWNLYKLNIGYDWVIRYGYVPTIDRLFFINDNDDQNDTLRAVSFYDEITDITDILPVEPMPKARFLFENGAEGLGTGVRFIAGVDNRDTADVTLGWDFGDGSRGSGFTPLHFFQRDGSYMVGLTARSVEGLFGRTTLRVQVGEARLNDRVTMALVGDMMLARRYEDPGGIITVNGPEAVFARIYRETRAVDIFAGNLECPLTDEGTPHPMKDYAFRGRPQNIAGLTFAGMDVAWQANNHVSDYSARGLEETIQLLDAAGIEHCGAGLNEYQALLPAFKSVGNLRVGFLSFCNRTGRDDNYRPFLEAGYDKDGFAYFSADNLVRTIPEAAAQCDLLVVAVHGGIEYAVTPAAVDNEEYPPWSDERFRYEATIDSATRDLEHLAIELGAGLIIGHHPHVQQGYEVYNGVVIAHSLGNFCFDQTIWETWVSAMVRTTLGRNGLEAVEVEPLFVDSYLPTPAIGRLGSAILDRLAGYSYQLNATLVPDYARMRAVVVRDPRDVSTTTTTHEVTVPLIWNARDSLYRSTPISLVGQGFPMEVTSVSPKGLDDDLQVRLGKDILMVGNLEAEGATVWNYNSASEGRDSVVVHRGRYAAFLRRNAGQGDAITDMTTRIPVYPNDKLTLSGWIRSTNGRDCNIQVRWFRYRNDAQAQNIFGDSTAGPKMNGDFDWRYVSAEMPVPVNAAFALIRWQNYAPQAGQGRIWVDDLDFVRWNDWQEIESPLPVDYPTDLCYLQIQSPHPIAQVTVRYKTATLSLR